MPDERARLFESRGFNCTLCDKRLETDNLIGGDVVALAIGMGWVSVMVANPRESGGTVLSMFCPTCSTRIAIMPDPVEGATL